MKKKFQGSTRAKRQQLQILSFEFELLRMKSGESVTDYFPRVMTIINKIRIHSDKTKEVTINEKILQIMTPKFYLMTLIYYQLTNYKVLCRFMNKKLHNNIEKK